MNINTTETLKVLAPFISDVHVNCYSADGKLVLDRMLTVGCEKKINLLHLKSGVYLIKIWSKEWNESIKIIL